MHSITVTPKTVS